MKNRIFLIRHGESVANKGNLKQGYDDFDLSEKWLVQSELIKLPSTVARIFCSNFKRAYQTASIVSKNLGFIPIAVDERLREWERFNELRNLSLTKENSDSINPYVLRYPSRKRYGEGESYFEVAHRIRDFLNEHLLSAKQSDSDVAIVSHAAAINHIIYQLLVWKNWSAAWHYSFIAHFMPVQNASITTLVYTDAGWKIEAFSAV